MSQSASETIIQICQALYSKGLTPTTALIKSRLLEPLPLPSIISGLRAWQASAHKGGAVDANENLEREKNRRVTDEAENIADKGEASLSLKVERLESQVKALQATVKALQAEVAALTRQ
ncbi:hypothetical protein PN836_007245 [Ningiella sp. W23]|uniref:hypothetical protein n=1 Tax=Ningiella sp. W23 TaxID=3023715 RepID=UPI00375821D5